MDSPRKRPGYWPKIVGFVVPSTLLLVVLAWFYWQPAATVRVDAERVRITTVTEDRFYEYINLDGRIEPAVTYVIDSKISGNVERIFVESGENVRQGDTLLQLSNADLELEVMQRESQLIEQLNNQQQTQLLINQNDFNRREQLVEIDFQLALQEKQFRRAEELLAGGVIATSDFEPTANRYRYYQRRRGLLAASFRADSLARQIQLKQLGASENRILNNLEKVRKILDRFYLLAATDGRLSDFTVQTGQAITSGQRLGEIYSLENPRIVAEIDEFYLNKVSVGQRGLLSARGDSLLLLVDKIYPNVNGGRFRIEASMADAQSVSSAFVKGQSVRFRLLFGPEDSSILLANGGFFGSTGGRWVYRLNDKVAERIPVRLGRANPNFYEVLEGLRPGDRVIVSAYDNFDQYQTIMLN
ncbi:efflux RND transporter periplasmic adaptor subunit [Neolewinella persica]|uniref:efflux RND transporter periplasmic adaptor subunit n=1 Tax=Neolewinella persica TaxID=70998 RepID=UPI0003A78D5F|nr:efflux RND transporter periplasmic adaptor subunit [Neolewinella persica]